MVPARSTAMKSPPRDSTTEAIKARPSAEPALSMLTATETVHTMPTSRAVFAHAKIVHIMEGTVEVATGQGTYRLTGGV